MVATGIERVPTEAERGEMQMLGDVTPVEIFLAELAKKGQEFAKKHLPFDEQCAKMDYQDEVDRITKEHERMYGFVKEDVIKGIKVNLEVYGKEDRFEIETEDEEVENKLIDGVRTQFKVGYTIKYRCKQRGHGISVFVPTVDYMKRFPNKFTEKELKKHFTEEDIKEIRKKKVEKVEVK